MGKLVISIIFTIFPVDDAQEIERILVMKKRYNIATIIGLMLLAAAVTFTVTYLTVESQFQEQLALEKSRDEALNKIVKVLNTIESDFIGEYDEEALIDGAVYGIVAATGDRWSFYLNKEDFTQYQADLMNQQVGIGVTVTYDAEESALVIVKVHPGSPADAGGLKKRDMIVGVDGESVSDLGYNGTVDKVRGAENTPVTLEIKRGETTFTIDIIRKTYLYNAVSSKIINGNIGYVKIDNFDGRVAVNFEDTIAKLLEAEVEGLILDVRGNLGGLKDSMVSMLDLLCPEGVLFIMRDKHGNESIDYSAPGEVDLPMVVIVDQDSYSAAEFFAVALQEFGKAEIVGTGTYGKGYSQVTKDLGDGTALNLSTNEYFTPKGRSLIGTGITPDYYVELDYDGNFLLLEEEEDNQLQKAIEVLSLRIFERESQKALEEASQ
jgi:carboxyl-terminal processing protease